MKKTVTVGLVILLAIILFLHKQSSPAPVSSSPSASTPPDNNIPLANSGARTTKKLFGTHVTPKDSPVSPEVFTGYHTALDFETFPEEQDAVVPVRAICDGELLLKKYVTGYGGVAVQSCVLEALNYETPFPF